jgi:hypothetical protein
MCQYVALTVAKLLPGKESLPTLLQIFWQKMNYVLKQKLCKDFSSNNIIVVFVFLYLLPIDPPLPLMF